MTRSSHSSTTRRAALSAVALLAFAGAGTSAALGNPAVARGRTTVRQPLRLALTTLQASHDLGDLGPKWMSSLGIEGTERLQFRWSTRVKTAAEGRWLLTDGSGEVLLKSGEVKAPTAPQYGYFSIPFQGISAYPKYLVRVQPLDAEGEAVGSPSPPVTVERVKPGPGTKFTDKGLQVPITGMLEAVRKKYDVPALGGMVVTRHGVDAVGVVGIRKHGSAAKAQVLDRWHLGSDTKAMTATLAGVLIDKGIMSWGTTVYDAFPEWRETMDERFKKVTLAHLMGHRSGIIGMLEAEKSALRNPGLSVPAQRREYTRLVTHRKHAGALGINYRYNNGNCILAGAMMERCTGKSWETLIRQELFEPLGMKSAGFRAPGQGSLTDQPWGHSDSSGERKANRGDNPASYGPAGTVHASLHDWAKFIRLHLNGKEGSLTLKPGTLAKLQTEFPPSYVSPNRYGWGWGMWDVKGGRALGHSGSNNSWFCTVNVYPDHGFGVLAVTNIGGSKEKHGHGDGDKACGEVVNNLVKRQME